MARGLSVCVLARRTCHVAHHGAIVGMWENGVPRSFAHVDVLPRGNTPSHSCRTSPLPLGLPPLPLRQDTGTTAQTRQKTKALRIQIFGRPSKIFSPNLQLSTKIPHSWTFFRNLKVETPALNRTHDRPMFERGYSLPHSTAFTTTSSHLTSSCPHSCPALRPEVIDFSRTHPHSTRTHGVFHEKLSYRETAHLRGIISTSLRLAHI